MGLRTVVLPNTDVIFLNFKIQCSAFVHMYNYVPNYIPGVTW